MTDSVPDWLRAARDKWTNRGTSRPSFAVDPGPGQESVWDYPRPPAVVPDDRTVEVHAGCVDHDALDPPEAPQGQPFALDPVVHAGHGHTRPCVGKEVVEHGLDLMGLRGQDDDGVLVDDGLRHVCVRPDPDGDGAVRCLPGQPVMADGVQVRAPCDHLHRLAGLGQPDGEGATDGTGPDDDGPWVRGCGHRPTNPGSRARP